MLFRLLDAFANTLPKKGALLGVDVGEKTFGLAESDAQRVVASPLKTLMRTKWCKDVQHLKHLVQTHHIVGFVVGWPLMMNGEEGARCHSTYHIVQNLLKEIEKPCLLWDERLSTMASQTMLEKEADLSRAKRARVVDAVAASLILGSALDALRRCGSHVS